MRQQLRIELVEVLVDAVKDRISARSDSGLEDPNEKHAERRGSHPLMRQHPEQTRQPDRPEDRESAQRQAIPRSESMPSKYPIISIRK